MQLNGFCNEIELTQYGSVSNGTSLSLFIKIYMVFI